MPDARQIADVRALLKGGKVQEADDILAMHEAAAAQLAGIVANKPAEPPPARAPNVIMLDLMHEIVAHLGNRPSLETLLEELRAATS